MKNDTRALLILAGALCAFFLAIGCASAIQEGWTDRHSIFVGLLLFVVVVSLSVAIAPWGEQ